MSAEPANLWRECVQWMIRCGIIDKTHRVTWKSAEILDFAQLLRDGVLVCHLANRLCRSSVDMRDVNLRPQMSQFLCLTNICCFLGACTKTFDLRQEDLFEAWELYKVHDFGKVLRTLSKLSTSPKALASGIQGFPDDAIPSSTTAPVSETHADYYNDEIYRNLAEEAESRELEEEIYAEQKDLEEGKIYDSIVTGSASQFREDFQPRDKRDHCIKELLDTEKRYVEALNMLVNKFYQPLKHVLNPHDMETIFMNLPELAQIHSAFLSDLTKSIRSSCLAFQPSPTSPPAVPVSQRIGDNFVHWKPKFVVYSEYCSKMPIAVQRIEEVCTESSAIKTKITECQSDANQNKFRLQDLLSVPMQRVLKYHLLLKELVKTTPAEHEDKPSLDAALDAMLDLSLYINEVKRDCEMLTVIKQVQSSILHLEIPDGTTLSSYGRLLKDGELKLNNHSDKKGVQVRYVFVFEKLMLICKTASKNQYQYKNFEYLADYSLNEESVEPVGTLRGGFKPKMYGFSLVHKQNVNVYQMNVKSQEQRIAWINAIRMAHDNVRPPGLSETSHLLKYTSFDKAAVCSVCGKLLRGIFHQGYKCISDHCEAVVHKECIAPSEQLPCPFVRTTSTQSSSVHRSHDGSRGAHRTSSMTGRISEGDHVIAVKAFHGNGAGPDYLEFDEHAIIEIRSTNIGNEGWWKGRLVDGAQRDREGIFPADHVRKRRHTPALVKRSSGLPLQVVGGRPPAPLPGTKKESVSVVVAPRSSPYANLTELDTFPWYLGDLDREVATVNLRGMVNGTFLVRYSAKQAKHAISVSYEGDVKHVIIEEGPQGFWLDEDTHPFLSIVELITYYEDHSMQESFRDLNTTLKYALKTAVVSYAIALHNFEPTAPQMVPLIKGDHVMVLNKTGDDRGWWKGKVRSKIGYFPLGYVREVESILSSPSRRTSMNSVNDAMHSLHMAPSSQNSSPTHQQNGAPSVRTQHI